jgi:hypothetical protein
MPWEQIIAVVLIAILWIGGWAYGSRPDRPPRRARLPFAG